jgi:hypothetical protein
MVNGETFHIFRIIVYEMRDVFSSKAEIFSFFVKCVGLNQSVRAFLILYNIRKG